MTWFASSANALEAAKEHYVSFLAVAFDFSSGVLYLWSGYGDLTIDSNLYFGMGHLARASNSPDRTNLTFERKTYQLSGADVDPAVVTEADIDASFGRSVVEYLGFINPETGVLLDVPEINFEGEISNIRRIDGSEPLIEVNAENRMILLDGTDGWRNTHEHQQEFYAGDLGYDQVPQIDLKEVLWGGHRVITGAAGGGSGGIWRGGGSMTIRNES